MLERNNLNPAQIVDARKDPLAGEEAWQLLASAREIVVAKGKSAVAFDPSVDGKEAILAQALGRTGNLRAPTLRLGDRLLVGFNDSLYSQFSG